MNARLYMPRVFRAAAVASLGITMVCGSLILFSRMASPANAAPPSADKSKEAERSLLAAPLAITYTTDVTWTTDRDVTETVFVDGAKLTILPGVSVSFASGTQLQMLNGGQLEATGTSTQPITFTSRLGSPDRGDWDGILFTATALTGTIQHAVIEYAQYGVELNRTGQYYNVSSNTFRYIGDYDGDPTDSGAIIGSPDRSDLSFNTVYSSEVGFHLSESADNNIRANHIYDIDSVGIHVESGGASNRDNDIIGNRIHDCGTFGIRLTNGHRSALHDNELYENGIAGVYIASEESLTLIGNIVRDNSINGLILDGSNTVGPFHSNAICASSGLEMDNRDGALTAEGNWWGTNSPAGEISGPVDYDPWIELALAPVPSSIPADGVSTATIDVAFNGGGQTVPPPARCLSVSTSAGDLSADTACVDDNGEAGLTLTAPITPGTAVVTAADACGYLVTTTVEFEAAYNLAITKTGSVSWAVPGQTISYTIEYANTEPFSATGVVITDRLPSHAGFVSSDPPPSDSSSGLITWTLNTLGPDTGGSIVLTATVDSSAPCNQWITNTAYIDGDGDEADTGDNSDSAAVQVRCGVNLVVVKNDGVGSGDPRPWVQAGDIITYTISVNNVGNHTASNVVLTETLPDHTTFVGPANPGCWSQVGTSNRFTCDIGTLDGLAGPGSNGRIVYFVVQVDPNLLCSTIETVNTVEVASDEPDLYTPDNTSNEQTPIRCGPSLRVHKDDGVVCVSPGQTITYTITYSNVGGLPVEDVLLTDVRPEYANFLVGGVNAGWIPAGGQVYTRALGMVEPGGPYGPVYFQAQVFDRTAIPSEVSSITNVIRISGGHTFTEVTSLPDVPDLAIAKNDNIGVTASEFSAMYQMVMGEPAPVSAQAVNVGPGEIIEYYVVYVNNGREIATNVMVTDTLPLYTSYAGGPEWTHVSGRLYRYPVGTLDPGEGGLLTFRVQVDDSLPAGLEWIINRVEIGGNELGDECNLGNNVSYEQTPVRSTDASTTVYMPLILKNFPKLPEPPEPPARLAWVSDVAVDSTTNQIFVASPRQDAVHVIDGGVDEYDQSVPVGHGPTGLAAMTSTAPSKVFAVHAYAYNDWTPGVWVIDTSSLASHPMTSNGGYVGAAPVKVTANPSTDRVFVSNYYDYMPILHGPSENLIKWINKKNFQASYGLDVSQSSNLVYMAAIDTGELIIFDGDWLEITPDYGACHHAPPEARVLRMVAVNEATGHVFVTSPPDLNKGQLDSKIFVLDEDILMAETGGAPSDTTCSWNFLGTGEVIITAIPGPAWIRTLDLPGAVSAGGEGVAVNPVTNRVYVTDGPGDQLFVLRDSITPTQISLLATVAVGDNPQGVDVNPDTNRVYVANARSGDAPYGTVSVVNGATNVVTKTIVLGP